MRLLQSIFFLFLLCGVQAQTHAGSGSLTNLRVLADPAGGPGLVARVNYYCGDLVWDGTVSSVSRQGNTVTITLPDSTGTICFGLPLPPADFDIPIGVLASGDYQLVIQQALPSPNPPVALISSTFSVASPGPYSNLRVVPASPLAYAPVSARLLFTCGLGFATAPPSTTVQADRITVRIPVTLASCFDGLPPPPFDQDLAIGNLPAGTYTLIVLQEAGTGNAIIPALSIPFAVQGGGAQSVPVNSPWTLWMLVAALGLIGLATVRRTLI